MGTGADESESAKAGRVVHAQASAAGRAREGEEADVDRQGFGRPWEDTEGGAKDASEEALSTL